MAFQQTTERRFTTLTEFKDHLVDDLTAAGFDVYRTELVDDSDDPLAPERGYQIFSAIDGSGENMYFNFRVNDPGHNPARESYSWSDMTYKVLSCRPSDQRESTAFFADTILTTYKGHNDYDGDTYLNGIQMALANASDSSIQTFYLNDADQVIVIVKIEVETGKYHYLAFGKLNKSIDGSQFATSSLGDRTSSYANQDYYIYPKSLFHDVSGSSHIFYRHGGYLTGETYSGWVLSINGSNEDLYSGSHQYSGANTRYILDAAASEKTGVTAFAPILFSLRNDENRSRIVGQPKDLYMIRMDYLNHGDIVTYGNDDYLILSMFTKDNDLQYEHNNEALVLKLPSGA